MTDIILQWDYQSINTVSFTDVILAIGNFRVHWVHRGCDRKWFDTVSEIIDDNNLVVEWDRGGRNSISIGDINWFNWNPLQNNVIADMIWASGNGKYFWMNKSSTSTYIAKTLFDKTMKI